MNKLSNQKNSLFSYIFSDIKENKNYHIIFLIFLAIIFSSYSFVFAQDDLMYFYDSINFKNDFLFRLSAEYRAGYPIIIYMINLLYLSPKIILLFGFILFYINNFVLIKLFFPNITKISWLFLSLLLIVNPFHIHLLYWSTMFFSIQLGVFMIFWSYYIFLYFSLNKYLKIIILAVFLCISIQIMPVIFYIYITILFLSIFYKFLLDGEATFKKIIKDNYLHIIYILLSVTIYFIIIKLLFFIFSINSHNYLPSRGEYIPIDSLSILFTRIKNIFLTLKNQLPIYFYSIIIINIMFLVYNLYKRRVYWLSILFFICIFILMFVPYITDILINIRGTPVRLHSIYYLFSILFMISLNVFHKYLVKILYVILAIYILMSVSLIDRYSKINANIHRINTYIYDRVELESSNLNISQSSNYKTKVYTYGSNKSFNIFKRDMDLLDIFSYKLRTTMYSKFYYQLPFLISNIGYYNVEHLFDDNIDKELRNIIDSKIQKDILFPKEGSIFEYNGNIYVIFSKDNR